MVSSKSPLASITLKEKQSKISCYSVETTVASLNQGKGFVIDAGEKIYTLYRRCCNPFENNKIVEVA